MPLEGLPLSRYTVIHINSAWHVLLSVISPSRACPNIVHQYPKALLPHNTSRSSQQALPVVHLLLGSVEAILSSFPRFDSCTKQITVINPAPRSDGKESLGDSGKVKVAARLSSTRVLSRMVLMTAQIAGPAPFPCPIPIIGLEAGQNNNAGITGLVVSIENKAPPRSIHGVDRVPSNKSAETFSEGKGTCVADLPVQIFEGMGDLHVGKVAEIFPLPVADIIHQRRGYLGEWANADKIDLLILLLNFRIVRRKVKLLEIDALDDRTELTSIRLVILYHDGVDLNAWFKDLAAMCYLFGALDLVMDALIPTWGVGTDLL
jgi:hypothetical protein